MLSFIQLPQEDFSHYQDVLIENNNEFKGIRTVSSNQYRLLEEIGKGQKAVIKSALLEDKSETQQAAAKMNFRKYTMKM